MPRSSGQKAMPRRAISFEARPISSRPSKRTEPVRWPTMPMIDLSVVVLPAPLRPSSVTTSPARTSKVDAVQDVRLAVPGLQVRRPRAAACRARSMADPQIGFAHLRVVRHGRVVALGEHAAAREHRDAVGQVATTLRLCSTISTVRLAATDLISAAMRSMSSWPMPAVGSSSSIISGSSASVVAISSARLRP